MENAVQALKMATAILIFIIAITVTFTMFARVKATTDSIVKMQDRQAYLDSAELDNGVLYTSSTAIEENNEGEQGTSKIPGMTIEGYRIVDFNDVISALYRYSTEMYGVTIIEGNNVIARYDSNTERDINALTIQNGDALNTLEDTIKNNLVDGKYITNAHSLTLRLDKIYKIKTNNSSDKSYGADWIGNHTWILNRINSDINGKEYTINNKTYDKKNLKEKLNGKKIIEIVRNIDNNTYVQDDDRGEDTALANKIEMPTTEIIYIVQ